MYESYMEVALQQARLGLEAGEIPVGAVMVLKGEIIAKAHNRCQELKDATAHAEMLVMRDASKQLGDWRLSECTLVVTLEPCCMCAGAIVNARVGKAVFGAYDKKIGGVVSKVDVSPIG